MAQETFTTIPPHDDVEGVCHARYGGYDVISTSVSSNVVFCEQASSINSSCQRLNMDSHSENSSEHILNKMLKLGEESTSGEGPAPADISGPVSADMSADLHYVGLEDWLKLKSDSMSSLDFDTDLKNSEMDIGDLFSLKGLQFQIGTNEGSSGAPSMIKEAYYSNLPAISAASEGNFQLQPISILKSEGMIDKGIFEEMLLADSLHKHKKKSESNNCNQAEKNSCDEILLPGFQELLCNPSLDKKEILHALQLSTLHDQNVLSGLDFDAPQNLTSSDDLDQLMENSNLHSLKRELESYRMSDDSNRDSRWVKNLLSNKIMEELNFDTLHNQEITSVDVIGHSSSEFLSANNANSNEIDCKLSSILAMTASDDNVDVSNASCSDLLDTIDKNFLKSDLGITPELPIIKSKVNLKALNRNSSISNQPLNLNDYVHIPLNSSSEHFPVTSCENSLLNSAIPNNTDNEPTVDLEPGLYQIVSDTNDSLLSLSYQLLYDDKNVPYLTPYVLPSISSASEDCDLPINAKSTQFNNTNTLTTPNPVLKIIQDQRQKYIASCLNSPTLNLNKPSVAPNISLVQPSLILGSSKIPDKSVVVPDNLLQALQESYKTLPKICIPSKINNAVAPSLGIKSKIVKVFKKSQSVSSQNLPKISIKKPSFERQIYSKEVHENVVGTRHEGKAKVVMSVNTEANLTSVHVLSSNKEQTVFKINTSDLVRAVSSIKDFHLEPLGLLQSQLVQRAITASEYIKDIQQKSGLNSNSSKTNKSGKQSQYQNFEINQVLPEFKPPISRKLNTKSEVIQASLSSLASQSVLDTSLQATTSDASKHHSIDHSENQAHVKINRPAIELPSFTKNPSKKICITPLNKAKITNLSSSSHATSTSNSISSTPVVSLVNNLKVTIPAVTMGNSLLHLPTYQVKTSKSKYKSITQLAKLTPTAASNCSPFSNTNNCKLL